jgi:hypothetical protein
VPRSSAARARPGPSASQAWRSWSSRRITYQGRSVGPCAGRRGARGPQRQGLGEALSRGAQVRAQGQAEAQVKPDAGPHCESERFPQVRCGVAGPARSQV